jgi:hypothetical protein
LKLTCMLLLINIFWWERTAFAFLLPSASNMCKHALWCWVLLHRLHCLLYYLSIFKPS